MRLFALAALLLSLGLAPAAAAQTAAVAAPAIDGPGALAHFDLARKDCLGTARNTTSKVWFTLANGVLSDVYYPTIDNTNVETLQFIVTDGATFTDLQTRDTVPTVRSLDRSGMACEVVSVARSGRYRIVADYVTDPDRDAVVLGPQRITYASLWEQSRRYARVLQDAGVGPGDRVALLMPNVPDFPRAYYAILSLGAVVVPVHALLVAREIGFVLRTHFSGWRAGVLVADRNLAEAIRIPPVAEFPLSNGGLRVTLLRFEIR